MEPHPRLYVDSEAIERARREPSIPWLRDAARQVAADAQRGARLPDLQWTPHSHNGHLIRARRMQTRVVTLLVRWFQTGQERFRRAALQCVRQMRDWEYWSWIAWRSGDSAPDALFDLSYGENSATLALAYDWLHDTLSDEERALFLETARKWPFAAGMKHARPGATWWFGRTDSNWNTVCAGGLGMLALAMYEDADEARELLPLVEESVAPYFLFLDETDGAWPEGIGYWNYGMRYAFLYLLSHERATGRKHPLFRHKGVRKTLEFPLDFCPHGQSCSFGDVNHWNPLPFHYAAARRLGRTDIAAALDDRLEAQGVRSGTWPDTAEWLLLHPGRTAQAERKPARGPVARLYRGMDWGVLADRMPDSTFYAAVRGGTTNVPHSHRDLLSFHCVVGRELLVTDIKPAEYLDTTFSVRRDEIFGITPASKNTVLINGVGITAGSALDRTERVSLPGAVGFRLVATEALGAMRDGSAVEFCARLVLLLDGSQLLIIDRAVLPHAGRMETRLHTYADVKAGKRGAVLHGRKERLRVAYAADVPAMLTLSVPAPTTPTAPAGHALRWCTVASTHTDMTLATLLSPSAGRARLELETGQRGQIRLTVGEREIRLTPTLRRARS
ncbi:MAG: hypothetical protein GXY85_04775 [Candidatus Brocadiaceae bacterium]|nr:hypothetical protein [Candidatus Brocadiaceae bacterium]